MLRNHHLWSVILLTVLMLQGRESSHAASSEPTPLASTSVTVQKEPLVHLSKSQSRVFGEALDALAAQGHVAIVAEGAPLRPLLAEEDTTDLTTPVPLSQAVEKFANDFDYDVQKSSRVFVLTKRYTDPKEMPCVTLEECQEAFEDIQALLDKFNPNFDERSDNSQHGAVIRLFSSLTPAQLAEAQAKTLHYSEMSVAQQEIVQRIFLAGFVQSPAQRVQETLNILDYAPKSVITGKYQDHTELMIRASGMTDKKFLYYRAIDFDGEVATTDEPVIMILPKLTSSSIVPISKETTLADVARLLSYTGSPPIVDAPLRNKPVSTAGLNNASTLDVLQGLAMLYDLRIGASDAGGPKLMRQSVATNISIQDLADTVWGVLPVSIRRAIQPEHTSPFIQNAPRVSAKAQKRLQGHLKTSNILPTLWTEADHQVLLGIQPQLRSYGLSVHIPVKSLDNPTQRALAMALCTGALEDLQIRFTGPRQQSAIQCFQDVDNIIIYTVPSEVGHIYGQPVSSLYFEGINPYTKQNVSLGGVGFGDIK